MAQTQIAAQLYTLRDHLKAPDDIARTLSRVARIGYRAVQLSALGPIAPRDLRRILDDEGLTACATHENFERLRREPDAVVEEHAVLGCTYTALPVTPPAYRSGEGYSRFAREASELAHRLASRGLVLGYHNHAFELERYGDRTGLEILYAESDAVLTAEIDTYWIQFGGGSPERWLRRVAGRSPLVHLKDMTVVDNTPVMAEVGEGNLDWPGILAACRDAGVIWYIVEQDHCRRDPFESLAISLRNLREMGVE